MELGREDVSPGLEAVHEGEQLRNTALEFESAISLLNRVDFVDEDGRRWELIDGELSRALKRHRRLLWPFYSRFRDR